MQVSREQFEANWEAVFGKKTDPLWYEPNPPARVSIFPTDPASHLPPKDPCPTNPT